MGDFFKKSEFYLTLVLFVMMAIFSIGSEEFFSLENLFDLLLSYSFVGIMAVGLLVVLISGGIDISFTATATVAQYSMALVIMDHGGGWITAFVVASAVGIALGWINGFLVHHLKVSAIIITIATLNVFYGLLVFVTKGRWLYSFPDWFGDGITLFSFGPDDIYSLSLPVAALLVSVTLTWILLNLTVTGRRIYAMGGNPDGARRMGFNLFRLRTFVYCYMGLMAGIGATVQAQLLQTVAPNSIVGREMEVLAAVVLGGASLSGGEGSVMGAVLGVAIIGILQNGLTLLGVSSYWHKVAIGLVILLSVAMTAWNRRREDMKGAEIDVLP
ncbi:ABC transporter permease [Dethiosulfovibrio salsuginis]|uniref:Monosaccharide ABC transporter membrane protein, CUT2 family n=1 Tax=Dethiosulfovibrio salsuginis TaxID=561720 RepID=A0A1X7JV08_9BACT|nr:ABC transporter permease [Dethiosulfovibrio salsuginis]SMG32282.1 monosaccharide ABC transporter membrane protein, CUT2 family [Dethiosulfovibrio salsuginis]